VSVPTVDTNPPLLCACWAAARSIEPARAFAAETLTMERTLRDLVNQAYALTPAEISLMWQTTSPRKCIMPGVGHENCCPSG
jgi:hypothetical protein